MKKIALAFALLGCSYGVIANTGSPCNDSTTGSGTATTAVDKFIKNAVTPKCSANTYVNFTETTVKIDVGSASKKGKKYFGGSSEGGAVKAIADCAQTPCAATDATLGVTAAGGGSGSASASGT